MGLPHSGGTARAILACRGTMVVRNVFEAIPSNLGEELTETLAARHGCRIERIVSRGHASPPEFWYDQESDECVLVLRGRAGLLFEGQSDPVSLSEGDYIHIPAHCRHRVAFTDSTRDTVWLAIFW